MRIPKQLSEMLKILIKKFLEQKIWRRIFRNNFPFRKHFHFYHTRGCAMLWMLFKMSELFFIVLKIVEPKMEEKADFQIIFWHATKTLIKFLNFNYFCYYERVFVFFQKHKKKRKEVKN
jgi:hypothetical protein